MGKLLIGFGICFWSVIVLNANLITFDRDISGVKIADLINVEDGLVF